MRTLLKVVVFVMVLCGSILIHEYGHLLAMQANGVRVVRFTIGFGPTLWSHTGSDGVEFAIKPILLGGYTEPAVEGPHSIEHATRAAQIVISLVGTLVNASAGFILLLLLLYSRAAGPPPWLDRRLGPDRPFAAAVVMSFGAWLIAPFRMAADYVRVLFGGSDRRKERQWAGKKATGFKGALISTLTFAAMINIGLAEFNMLPFRPLDGAAAMAQVIGAVLGDGAQDWFDRWSFLILINLVLFSSFVRARPRRSDGSEPPSP